MNRFSLRRRLMGFAASLTAAALLATGFPQSTTAYPASYGAAVAIDGMIIQTDWSTAPYVTQEGRVMISVRSLAYALADRGCWVSWDQNQFAAYLYCEDKLVRMGFHLENGVLVGDSNATMTGREYELLQPPELNRDRAFLGLRDIANLLGYRVDWDDENRIASIATDKVVMVDREQYETAVAWLNQYTWAFLNDDDTVSYSLSIPDDVVIPRDVPASYMETYQRGLERNHEMADLYTLYAYADPDPGRGILPAVEPGQPVLAGTVQLSDNMIARPEYASAKALAAQRHALAEQARGEIARAGGKVRADSATLNGLTTYRTKDGILVRIVPGGELHFLDPAQKGDFLSKISTMQILSGSGAVGSFLLGTVAKFWPAGSTVAALVLVGTFGFSTWLTQRVEKYCARPGTSGAIVVKYWYLKFPDKFAQATDTWLRSNLGLSPNLEMISAAIPRDCEPWVAWGLSNGN